MSSTPLPTIVEGGRGDDTLIGNSESNTLRGGPGNDTLRGGAGDDQLDGGDGNDTADYSALTTTVVVDLSISRATGDGSDALVSIENIIGGSGGDILIGNGHNNQLQGGEGNDILDGGAGKDLLEGGAGDDHLSGGSGNDILNGGSGNDILVGGAGIDELNGGDGVDTADYSALTTAVVADLSSGRVKADGNATLSSIENIRGGSGNDVLIGDVNDNALHGGAGNDSLSGGAGDDHLDGGSGNDTADYSALTTAVLVDLTSGTAIGDGNDTLINIENIRGGSGDDTLIGESGDNTIQGGYGDDSLSGGSGNDRLDGGGGEDTADYSAQTTAVTVDLANRTATGDGNDTLISIENSRGGSADDLLIGNSENNTLQGEEGNDNADQLFIDPVECIDCGACVPACPVSAIFPEEDMPADQISFIAKNRTHFGL